MARKQKQKNDVSARSAPVLRTQQSHSNRATVLSVRSEPRCYKQDELES
jgi:hypothetical protein